MASTRTSDTETLWGVNVVQSTQQSAGTAAVLSVQSGAAVVYVREALTTFFDPYSQASSNIYQYIAESRLCVGYASCRRDQHRDRPTDLVITRRFKMTEKTVKVRVSDRWRVVHDDKPYIKGDELTVPENVAQEWEQSGWVERVTAAKK